MRWNPTWHLDAAGTKNAGQDSIVLRNAELGVGIAVSGMRAYDGNATRCFVDHWQRMSQQQFAPFTLVTLTTKRGQTLENRTLSEAWSVTQVVGYDRHGASPDNPLIMIVLCRRIGPDAVIAFQTSLFWSEWATTMPALLDLINGVELPATAPAHQPFTVATPLVILPEETATPNDQPPPEPDPEARPTAWASSTAPAA